ncbi:hypothetical protein [Alkalibacter mobilis]|uniref:hypothetical protein n=1 Tax=Alkalibacter mobilis TaxID=2787712 RepID=UPI00189CD9FD|nr:hypothetical protein [Alkalibacter mobilis]MBF7097097.1 hypothetical protein [Alkalibacter mobilis]
MNLEHIYEESILPLRQHFLIVKAIIKSSLVFLLYLAAIPFASYSFMYIYMGDGSFESISSIPDSIISIVFILNLIIFLFLIPFIMLLTNNFITGKNFGFVEIISKATTKLIPLFSGYLLMILSIFLLSTVIVSLLPVFYGNSLIFSIFSMAIILVTVYFYLNIMFWSHYVIINNSSVVKSFKSSRKLFKKYKLYVLKYSLTFFLLSFILINSFDYLTSTIIKNAMASNFTLAFFQSMVFIFVQLLLSSLFLNLSKYDATSDNL